MPGMQEFTKSFDGAMYSAGQQYRDDEGRKITPLQYMGWQAKRMGAWPEDKELDQLTDRLIKKHLIPEWAETKRHQARELAAQKWVLGTYFRDHKITPSGPYADTVEKAFAVVPAELTVFPFFWDTIIIEQILAVPLLDIMVADTVSINSGTYVHAYMNETPLDRSIGEGTEFGIPQEINITSAESTIKLKKLQAQTVVSDEAMRRMRIPIFARGYARYGRQIGIDVTDLGLDVVLNGDSQFGGAFGAATTIAATAPGTPTYGDYVRLFMNFDIGYEPTDLILSRSGITKLLSIPEFKDPLAGFRFAATAILPEAFGLMPHRWDSTKSSSWTSGGVLGDGTKALVIQRGRALILAQEGGLSTESFRLPSQQTQVTSSWYLNFAVADNGARRVMTGVA